MQADDLKPAKSTGARERPASPPEAKEGEAEAGEAQEGGTEEGGGAALALGDGIEAPRAAWSFGGNVCDVFDSHVAKSVPLYRESHRLGLQMADFFVHDGSTVYDIGCSTGALLRSLAAHTTARNVRFIGIDPVSEMIEHARERSRGLDGLEFVHADAVDFDFQKADLILSYYTVQFILPKHRQALIDRLYEALNWGGALFLFEKMRMPDARFQDLVTQLYQEFKLDNGYSADDILGKTRSLKGVMEPFSEQANCDMLRRAGFRDMTSVLRYLAFVGYVAIK